jgi:hypothetical protein
LLYNSSCLLLRDFSFLLYLLQAAIGQSLDD